MKVYFVRHGESELNAKRIHQNANTPLSALGKKQAKIVGKRLAKIEFDVIVSSTYPRALQTAEAIGAATGKPIERNELLREIKRPTSMEGRLWDDPEMIQLDGVIEDMGHDPHWRHEDEENFFDLKYRAEKALESLTTIDAENVVAVTHGSFLRYMLCVMMFGEELTHKEVKKLRWTFRMSNTGISMCEYKDNRWRVICWNDHSHLG